jgi:hypothetical protein
MIGNFEKLEEVPYVLNTEKLYENWKNWKLIR